jgi:hypothetical protein
MLRGPGTQCPAISPSIEPRGLCDSTVDFRLTNSFDHICPLEAAEQLDLLRAELLLGQDPRISKLGQFLNLVGDARRT